MLVFVRQLISSLRSFYGLTCLKRRPLHRKLDLWTPWAWLESERHMDCGPSLILFCITAGSPRTSICSGKLMFPSWIERCLCAKQANRNLFPFNSSFMATLQNISDSCGYTDYLDKFVTYPPAGQLPLPNGTDATFSPVPSCMIHDLIQGAVSLWATVHSLR